MPKYCEICDVNIPSLFKHKQTAKHMKREADLKKCDEYKEQVKATLQKLDMDLINRMMKKHYVVRRYYDDETKMIKEEIIT